MFHRILAAFHHLPVVLALLALGLLPPGVMPQQSANGIEMVLCSGDGAVTMVLDPATGTVTPKQPETSAKPGCDWAMAQAIAALPAVAQPLTLPETIGQRATPALATTLWLPGHDPRGIWARGPPSLI